MDVHVQLLAVACIMGLLALAGIICLEVALFNMRRILAVDEERDSKFPSIRKLNIDKLTRWNLYPGAITVLSLRIISLFVLIFISNILYLPVFFLHDLQKSPLPPGKLRLYRDYVSIFYWRGILLLWSIKTNYSRESYDYSYYLGPNYRFEISDKPASTYVANHPSAIDAAVISADLFGTARVAKMTSVPMIFRFILRMSEDVAVGSERTEETRKTALNKIIQYQTQVEQGKRGPLLLFPEGTNLNGAYVRKFSKGAFCAEKKIVPTVINYDLSACSPPIFDCISAYTLIILAFSTFNHPVTVTYLEPFEPTEYLFKTHADKGKEKWEIFAWAVRDIILKKGKFKPCNMPWAEISQYLKWANCKVDSPFLSCLDAHFDV